MTKWHFSTRPMSRGGFGPGSSSDRVASHGVEVRRSKSTGCGARVPAFLCEYPHLYFLQLDDTEESCQPPPPESRGYWGTQFLSGAALSVLGATCFLVVYGATSGKFHLQVCRNPC